jgi:hypothetical protein
MRLRTEVVATFNDLEKAHAAQADLERAGIEAKVADQSKLQRFIFLSKPLASAKVVVKETDFAKARQVLQSADEQDHVLLDEVRCLKCGSPHVEYPQFSRKSITTTVFAVTGSVLHLIDKEFYCRDCQHTWPAKDMLRRRTDILNWPAKDGGVVKQERG